MSRFPSSGVVVASLFLGACLSSAPPAPPVRFFDPLPAASAAAPNVPVQVAAHAWRITSAPHLGREFTVRTGPREVVFDPLHSWIATPRELVEAALAGRSAVTPGGVVAELRITAFEIDLAETPRARVHLVLLVPGEPRRDVEATAPSLANGPEDFALAMAAALATAVGEVAALR